MNNDKHVKALMYSGALFLIILSVLAISATVFVMNGNKSYDENTIAVTGTAEVSATPDIATFSFTVQETADAAEDAQSVINEKVSKILVGLKEFGIDDKDIKTESYTIYPKYEWVKITESEPKLALSGEYYVPSQNNKQVQIGFDVSQNVRVTMRDLEKVSSALTLFAANAVENLNGPQFEIDNPQSLKEQARRDAINDAKVKAQRLAADLDVELGKIVSFNESSYNPQPYYGGAMMKAAAYDSIESYTPELPTGENDITANVTITYKIK